MLSCSDDVRRTTDECSPPFHRKQRQHGSSSKANRQLVERTSPSSAGGTDLRISSPNTFTRNGSKLNTWTNRGCDIDLIQ
ncbi:unnamed protein product [Protopolystoma xenopodis]|uniref:Uncharacterized protein n=1 Tax=Protopolystoma xenopodis TaxID=117903 RepID=A0A448WUK1_9PLAT|nr:unnamed protein product [Protopolystoma xenopodis]